jgi:hypothetical protein
MNVRSHRSFGAMALGLVLGAGLLRGEEPARRTATPIIFSAPQSDTVSSNLNQISSKPSLRDLESDLKKPFEIFQTAPQSRFQPPVKLTTPPAPVVNSRKLKELLDKRAEEIYLSPDAATDDEFLRESESDSDPFHRNKPKNSVERYYDRLDRTGALTNHTRGSDLFGDKPGSEAGAALSLDRPLNPLDEAAGSTARNFRFLSNAIPDRGGAYSQDLKPRTFGDIFGLGPGDTSERLSQSRESRLDSFKRLLEGPAAPSRVDFNAPPPAAPSTTALPSPTYAPAAAPVWSSTAKPVAGSSFSSSAGVVGAPAKPQGLPDFAVSASSLATTPQGQPAKALPPPTFKVPKRQF